MRSGRASRISTATNETVRELNKSIILNLIRLHQPISRKGLSDRTGIFPSNISAIVEELLAEGLVVEERARAVSRGRVPVNLFLNPNGFRVLGISIRDDRTALAWAGLPGRIISTHSFATPQSPTVFMRELKKSYSTMWAKLDRADRNRVQRVGISVPGLVLPENGRILMTPSLPQFAGYPLGQAVADQFGAPVILDNDSNIGTLAEVWLNEAEVTGLHDFVLLAIGPVGVGAGVFLNSQPYRGHDLAWVGEYGHMVIDPKGPQCSCGRRGCWELFVSDQATWRRFQPRSRYSAEGFQRLIRLAQARDTKALDAFHQTAEYLSLGLSNITFALNPSAIVVAGEIAKVWNLIGHTAQTAWASPRVSPRVRLCRLPLDELYLQGAVVLALQHVFAQPRVGRFR